MKKLGFMTAALGLALVGGAFAQNHHFNQPMTSQQMGRGGFHHGGGFHGNPGGHHGRHQDGRHQGNQARQVLPDPKNPASVRDWSKPQAKSVYCIGAGCTLHYPTPRQQARTNGTMICNNSGCHRTR